MQKSFFIWSVDTEHSAQCPLTGARLKPAQVGKTPFVVFLLARKNRRNGKENPKTLPHLIDPRLGRLGKQEEEERRCPATIQNWRAATTLPVKPINLAGLGNNLIKFLKVISAPFNQII
jgi:hypothetical protein